MTHLEDIVLVFHEPDCCGLIVSDDTGQLRCAECGESWQLWPELFDSLRRWPVAAVQALMDMITRP